MFLLVRHELKTQVSPSLAGGDHLFFDLLWPLAAVGISVLLSEAQSAAPVAWPSGNMAHSQGGDMELLSLGQTCVHVAASGPRDSGSARSWVRPTSAPPWQPATALQRDLPPLCPSAVGTSPALLSRAQHEDVVADLPPDGLSPQARAFPPAVHFLPPGSQTADGAPRTRGCRARCRSSCAGPSAGIR